MPVVLRHSRALTVLAVGFLALDGVLLGLAGFWLRNVVLVLIAMVLVGAAAVTLLLWRRHCLRLEEIAEVRSQLREEARALAELVKGGKH
jgi:hypothetical protein